MAHFYAEIKGNRGLATRMGSADSGIWGHIRGWNIGARVICYVNSEGKDVVDVYRTGGSSGRVPEKLVAQWIEGERE